MNRNLVGILFIIQILISLFPFAYIQLEITNGSLQSTLSTKDTPKQKSVALSRQTNRSSSAKTYQMYSDIVDMVPKPILIYESEEQIIDIDVSGDGRYVVFLDGYKIKVFDTYKGTVQTVYTAADYFEDIEISLLGYLSAAVNYRTGELIIFNASSLVSARYTFSGYKPSVVAVSSSGRYVAFGGDLLGVYKAGVGIIWTNETIYGDNIGISGDESKVIIWDREFGVFDIDTGDTLYYNDDPAITPEEIKVDYYGNIWALEYSAEDSIYFVDKDNYNSYSLVFTAPVGSSIGSFDISGDGVYLAIAITGDYYFIDLINTYTNKLTKRLYLPPEEGIGMELSHQGDSIAIKVDSGDVLIYNITEDNYYVLGYVDDMIAINCFSYARIGNVVAITDDIYLSVFEVNKTTTNIIPLPAIYSEADYDIDERGLVLGYSNNYYAGAFDITRSPDPHLFNFSFSGSLVTGVSPDGSLFGFGAYEDLYIYDSSGNILFHNAYPQEIQYIYFFDNYMVVLASEDFYIYSIPDFTLVYDGSASGELSFAEKSPNGNYLVISGSYDFYVFDLSNGDLLFHYSNAFSYTKAIINDHGIIAFASLLGDNITLIDLNGKKIWSKALYYIQDISFVGANGLAVTCNNTYLYYLDINTGDILWSYNLEINNVLFSPMFVKSNRNGSIIYVYGEEQSNFYVLVLSTFEMQAYWLAYGHGRHERIKVLSDDNLLALIGDTYDPLIIINPISTEDTYPPTLQITNPKNNSEVYGEVDIKVNVYDPSGISKVSFYINGSLIYEDYSYPYSYSWNTLDYADGTYNITVSAWDNSPYKNQATTWILVRLNNTLYELIYLNVSGPENLLAYLYDNVKIIWTIDSATSGKYTIYKNGTVIMQGSFEDGVTDISLDFRAEELGVYNITIYAVNANGTEDTETCLVQVDLGMRVKGIQNKSYISDLIEISVEFLGNWTPMQIDFYVNDDLKYSDTSPPWSWTWDTSLEETGQKIIKIDAHRKTSHKTLVYIINFEADPFGDFDEDTVPNYLEIKGLDVLSLGFDINVPLLNVPLTVKIRFVRPPGSDSLESFVEYFNKYGSHIHLVDENAFALGVIVELSNATELIYRLLEAVGMTELMFFISPTISSDDTLRLYALALAHIEISDLVSLIVDYVKAINDPLGFIDVINDVIEIIGNFDLEFGIITDADRYIGIHFLFNLRDFLESLIESSPLLLSTIKFIISYLQAKMNFKAHILSFIGSSIQFAVTYLNIKSKFVDWILIALSVADPPESYLRINVYSNENRICTVSPGNNISSWNNGIVFMDTFDGFIIVRKHNAKLKIETEFVSSIQNETKYAIIILDGTTSNLMAGGGQIESGTPHVLEVNINDAGVSVDRYRIKNLTIPNQIRAGEKTLITLEVQKNNIITTEADVFMLINDSKKVKFEARDEIYSLQIVFNDSGIIELYIYVKTKSGIPDAKIVLINVQQSTKGITSQISIILIIAILLIVGTVSFGIFLLYRKKLISLSRFFKVR